MRNQVQDESCATCRYRGRGPLENPCYTGVYQLRYSKRCFCWKPLRWWQRAVDWLLRRKEDNHE